MCGCSDLKYAKKNHVHNYVSQAALDAAIAGAGHIDQAAVDAAIAASGHVDQAAVDASIAASGHATQAALDAVIADHDTDIQNLQNQIDALQQALIDCGCVVECNDWLEDFPANVDNAFISQPSDWDLYWVSGGARVERDNGATDQVCNLLITAPGEGDFPYVEGMTLEWDMDNTIFVDEVIISVNYFAGGQIPSSQVVWTAVPPDDTQTGIDLSFMDAGDIISHIKFSVTAIDASTTRSTVTIDYVNIICPA